MERNAILKLAESYDSFYLYEEAVILRNINRLKADFPGVSFLYSAKCNPYPKVLECVLAQGFGIDAASAAECVMGQRAGLEPNQILYSAPGKTLADIKAALPIATVIADSAGEVGRIQQAAAELGITADIGLRVNPDFSYGTDSGAASKFGIDEAQIYAKLPEWKQLPNIRIVGIHTHLKSQELSVEVLKSYYQKMFRLAVSMREVFGILKFLNLGSGMGIPMRETEQPFDTAALGQEAQRLMTAFREKLPETRIRHGGHLCCPGCGQKDLLRQDLCTAEQHAQRLCPSLHSGDDAAFHGRWSDRRVGADLYRRSYGSNHSAGRNTRAGDSHGSRQPLYRYGCCVGRCRAAPYGGGGRSGHPECGGLCGGYNAYAVRVIEAPGAAVPPHGRYSGRYRFLSVPCRFQAGHQSARKGFHVALGLRGSDVEGITEGPGGVG